MLLAASASGQRQDHHRGQGRPLRNGAPGVQDIARADPAAQRRIIRGNRDPADRRRAAEKAREPVARRDAKRLPQVPSRGADDPEPPDKPRMFFAQVAENRLAVLRVANNRGQNLFGEFHDRSRIDSRPLVMLLSASCVARMALRPACVTVK